jgi:polar amino acid transport system substrate-binding protein
MKLLRWSGLALMAVGVILLLARIGFPIAAQEGAPTLVPPTPIPVIETGQTEILQSESAVARIQQRGVVRVGVLFNAPPFGEMNVRGVVSGYDADVANSLASAWGAQTEFVQVTRNVEDAFALLRAGAVDMLMAALIHRREYDDEVEFSQAYYIGRQAMMVRTDDAAQSLADLANRRVGVVVASPAEAAAVRWISASGTSASLETFFTLDRAYVALLEGRIDGVIDRETDLRRVSALAPETIRLLDEPVEAEPHAIAVVRQDISMRSLVDRTLQYLTQTGRMNEIYQVHFPGAPFGAITPWANVGESAPTPGQYAADLQYPSQYTLPRVQSSGVLRVAGITGAANRDDALESERRADAYSLAVAEEIARRWGGALQVVDAGGSNPFDLLANGQADLVVNVVADWNLADRADFTSPYLLHGDRLMVVIDSDFESFFDLRGGRIIATPIEDAGAVTRAVAIAEALNVRVETFQTREPDIPLQILENDNANVAFGDSLALIAHVQNYPDIFTLTILDDGRPEWFSRSYRTMAVPRNDLDFRLLVEYTLQEMARDGTLTRLAAPVMLPGEMPAWVIWPGASDYLTLPLAGG